VWPGRSKGNPLLFAIHRILGFDLGEDFGVSIAEHLTSVDSTNAGWQQTLGLAYTDVGMWDLNQGEFEEALASFEKYLAIAQRFALLNPTSAAWQHELLVIHGNIAVVHIGAGRFEQALASSLESLRLALLDASNVAAQYALAAAHSRAGEVYDKLGRAMRDRVAAKVKALAPPDSSNS
jgi:tetratricopeptide (TPR) repeat protein